MKYSKKSNYDDSQLRIDTKASDGKFIQVRL